MNELDVLEAWHPAATADTDHETAARSALDTAMARRAPTVGRRLAGRALIAAAVTTALVAGGVLVANRVVDDRLDRVKRVHVGGLDVPAPGAPMNVLVVGSDSRAFVDDRQQADAFGTPAIEGGQRSDTMILVRIAGDAVTAVSLPRDLVVTDASGAEVQLNSFFNTGPESLIAAVRTLTGAPIDHFVQVDFAAFIKVVDALGGVRMWVPTAMRDTYSGLDVATAGCTTFDGARALAWARSRHAEYLQGGRWVDASPHADLDRIARQQALLRAIGLQTRARVGGDVVKAGRVLDAVVPSLQVDAGMGRDTIRSFIGHLVRPDDLVTVTVANEPAPDAPGRLRMLDRPTGEDFFTWATAAAVPAPVRDGVTADPGPAAGASC